MFQYRPVMHARTPGAGAASRATTRPNDDPKELRAIRLTVPELASRLATLTAPRKDRRTTRPPQLDFGPEEAPGAAQTAALAAQQLAIQAIYLILPGFVAAQYGLLAMDVLNFVCLSVAAVGVAGLLQTLPRGPVGSGYPVASIPAPIFVAVYLSAASEAHLGTVAAVTALTGVVGLVLGATLRRIQKLVPTEVAGVVVLLIGVSLLPRAFAAASNAAANPLHPAIAFGTLAAMVALALKGGRLARFAVLVGALLGTIVALAVGLGASDLDLLASAPWVALPRPMPPSLGAFDPALLPAFLVALLASFASWTGDLLAFQRAADGNWRRPDPAPLRRGLVAQSLAVVAAGLAGAMPTGTSSACVGLAIGTRVLSRRVAIFAAVALLVLACCPKLLALLLALPDPVEAAMLLYVCCFMLASGCQLMGARMLDTRRTFTVGLGLALGLGTLLDAPIIAQLLPPMLRSPITAGALGAILLNLLTAPLVAQRAAFTIQPGAGLNQALLDQVEALGGAWGARRETMTQIGHALLELEELLAARGGNAEIAVRMHYATDRILVTAAWMGTDLPEPAARPDFADLEGSRTAQEAFALWLATRNAERVDQRTTPAGAELRLSFAD
jgi:NCS2 family nucleobase:cation symporter-2